MERDLSNEYYSKRFEDKIRIIDKYVDWVSVKYIDGSGESKVYSIRLGIMIGNKLKEVDINKKRIHNINNRLIYKVNPQSVKSSFLLYKNDFKFQLGFKVVVKKGTNKIKSSLQTIDFEYDTINFKIKK